MSRLDPLTTDPRLTPAQEEAVLYFAGDSAILSAAGSGKTLVLVEKVAALVERQGIPVENLLVVTFTEKAATELKERIARRLNVGIQNFEPLQKMSIGTIHAFAASLLPPARILDEPLAHLERLRTVRETLLALAEAGETEALQAIDRLGGFHPAVRSFLEILGKNREGGPFPRTLEKIRSTYDQRKQGQNLLDYDDLERLAQKLLSREEERRAVRRRFRWILVDEFQDVSPLQWEILSLLHDPPRNRLTIVGDPRQSIYRFRGADPTLFRKVSEEIQASGGRLFHLNENFRSSPAVVDFVNRATRDLFSELPPLVATRREIPGGIEFLLLPSPPPSPRNLTEQRRHEAETVATRILRLREEGISFRSIVLLFRTRRAVPFYEEQLRHRQIPYDTSLGEPLLERPEVLSLIVWMKWWMKRWLAPPGTSQPFLDAAIALSPLAGFAEEIPPEPIETFLQTLFEKTLPLFPEEYRRNLLHLQKLLEDLLTLGVKDLKGLLTTLQGLREEEAPISCPPPEANGAGPEAVRLLTIHGAKGLEFPVVFLCDLGARRTGSRRLFLQGDDGVLAFREADREAAGLKRPLLKDEIFEKLEGREKEEDLEESKRLFYVALTRAIERLILPLPPAASGGKGGNLWSEWLHAARRSEKDS